MSTNYILTRVGNIFSQTVIFSQRFIKRSLKEFTQGRYWIKPKWKQTMIETDKTEIDWN